MGITISKKGVTGRRLKKLRETLGYSQEKMAKMLDLKLRTYQSYERGENMTPIEILEKAIKPTTFNLGYFGEEEVQDKTGIRISVYGSVPGGQWSEPIENKEYITVPSRINISPPVFGLWVYGDSMEPDYPDGSFIFVDPEADYIQGDPCIFRLNGEVNFKRYFKYGNQVILQPDNRKYPPTTIKGDTPLEFIGKVIRPRGS